MKRKFEELRENLDEFAEQNDYPVLVVSCLSDELAYVAKFLQGLEQTHPESFFVIFPQPFLNAGGYLDGVVESIRLQVEAAGPLRAERGEPPFPPVPPGLADLGQPPEERLNAILRYLVSLLPNPNDHRVIVGLLPLKCLDLPAYARLITAIIPGADAAPWTAPLRIVAYDDRGQGVLGQMLRERGIDQALTYPVDFSTPALTDALTRDAADVSLSVTERMGCLMQLAALDYSYRRYPDALEKYGLLYQYYEREKIPSMQALCLLGAADTLRGAGRPAEAKEHLQRSIALSMQSKSLPPLLNALISITDLCMDQGQYEEAESYADSGAQVAAGALNPFACADLRERKGDAQRAQGKSAEALASYQGSRSLCQMYEHFYRWKSVLSKQADLYADLKMEGEAREANLELDRVEDLERRGGQAGVQAETQAQAQGGMA
jgi:tetratricopeptide (TPR) repeat protein